MKFKKIIATVLCFAVALGVASPAVFADESKDNNYPIILVHGFMGWGEQDGVNSFIPYWGTTSGNVLKYIRNKGFDVYTASTGGQNSVWDQTCELYAQLTGTRVDYGEAHSTEHGHSRFGRTYDEKLCPSFGETKVHLYGYSVGGSIVRLFASLLEYGYPEEVAACDDASELFKGGNEDLIYSVTATAATHSGTLLLDREGNVFINRLIEFVLVVMGLIGNSPFRGWFDIQMEQFGYTDSTDDGMNGKFSFSTAMKILDSVDCAFYDATVEGAAELNKKIKIVDDIYYFSVSSESVFKSPLSGNIYPDIYMNPIMFITAPIIANFDVGEYMGEYIDESWYVNDGIISFNQSLHPEDEPYKDYDPDDVEKGIWNMVVVDNMDHTDYMGFITNPVKPYRFYKDFFDMLYSI